LEFFVSHFSLTAPGRVVHDPKGNAVWDWAIATGVLAKASINELLTALTGTTPTLSVEEGQQAPGEWAGDPYNRSPR
jgi:hypothetical protein